ncbi:MAG: chain length determinant protein EpsF [Gammaproteobacteria bacterium]|nr:chain length determinant protein EpsF [Gammaproteobacteria bacterium]
MTYRQFVGILRARWRLVAAIFGGILLLTALGTIFWPRAYEATASVVVDINADPTTGTVNPDQLLTSYLATQVDIASSDRVVRRVVKALKLDADPERRAKWLRKTGGEGDFIAWLIHGVRTEIAVTPSRDSSVITITALTSDRKSSVALANAFAEAYVDTTIDLKVEPARQYAAWFADRSREFQADLEAKQKRLSDYQTANGITATDEKLDIESSRLADLSTAVTKAQEEYQEKDSIQRHAQAGADSVPEVLQNPLISSLKSELAMAESKLKDLSTNVGVNYPQYQAAAAQVASLRARLAEETAQILSSLKGDAQLSSRQHSDARAALEAQKRRVLELKHQRDQVQVLQNDVTAAQKALDDVTQRRSQNSLASQIEQTNVLPLTEAVEPPFAAVPVIKLNVAVGLALALLLSVGTALVLELNNPIVRTEEDLLRVVGAPLLGSVRSATGVTAAALKEGAATRVPEQQRAAMLEARAS